MTLTMSRLYRCCVECRETAAEGYQSKWDWQELNVMNIEWTFAHLYQYLFAKSDLSDQARLFGAVKQVTIRVKVTRNICNMLI